MSTPPRPARKGKKVIPPSPVSSRSSSSSSPLRPANASLNDDAQEKAARRSGGLAAGRRSGLKNVRHAPESDEDAEEEEEDGGDEYGAATPPPKQAKKKPHLHGRKLTTISTSPPAAPATPSRLSGGGAAAAVSPATRKRLSVINRIVTGPAGAAGVGGLAGGVAGVSREVMDNNFEEWMKMATDNKITSTNTWSFALIDYFADLTLLRNTSDQSINFQKASCTLDGCIKIWTSRVDSVATETGRLLSGLSGGGEGGDEDGEGEDGEEEGEEGESVKKAKRKAVRSESTLAKSFATLAIKKFDLEFTVDPLFKKTCADFDEGGAMGLLMNHLGVDGKGRVVFDAGDVEEEEEEEEGEGGVEEVGVDLARLREFIPDISEAFNRNISVTLSDFKFSSDPNEAFSLSMLGLASDPSDGMEAGSHSFSADAAGGDAGVQDFFGDDGGEDFGGGDFGGGGGEDEDGEGESGGMSGGMRAEERGPASGGLVMTMGEAGEGDEGMMFDYFDQGFSKNWAGPEHWKLRKVTRKADPNALGGATTTAASKSKKDKTPFLISFEDPPTMSTKQLFTAGARSSIAQPKLVAAVSAGRRKSGKKGKKEEVKRDEHLLPDDMHFSSRQLLRLFLKPKFTLKTKKRNGGAVPGRDGEIDENFWAAAAADRAGDDDMGDDGMMDSQATPFDTQFFHDDDGADFAEVDDGLGLGADDDDGPAGEDDLWAGTQGQLKKIKVESVHYAKRAKRVDVKRLKDNIWKGLDILVEPVVPSESESDASEAPSLPVQVENNLVQPRTFDSVIENLRQSYPQEKMSEISTSFCFICLLHLANEQGLKIEPARFDDGAGVEGFAGEAEGVTDDGTGKTKGKAIDERADRVVGELQALKIWKDLNAGQSA